MDMVQKKDYYFLALKCSRCQSLVLLFVPGVSLGCDFVFKVLVRCVTVL